MDGKIFARIAAALFLLAVIAAIGFFAFRAGVAQGSPVTLQAPSGDTPPVPYPYPYHYGYFFPFHWGFGFGCFGLLIPLFLIFLAMRAFHLMIWGPRRWAHLHGHGPWGAGVPPMFDEWHKRAHGETDQGSEKQ
jgi:hypothetical protein